MSKKLRIMGALKSRAYTIIREDVETEGFWETVAEHYGVDQNDLTERQREAAERAMERLAERLNR